ncbi:MAG: MFS transporter [Pseudomonadota bacterium]
MQAAGREAFQGRVAVSALFLANGFVMGAWAPQIPLLLPRHGITEFTLGLLILGLGIGAVGAMLFAGRLIARFGSRAVLRGFALSIVPVLPIVVYAPSVPVLALAMAILGALIGCMDVAMNANAVEVERRLGRAIMSASHGFWSLGGFVGGSLGGLLIARTSAEVQALTVSAVVAVIVLVAMRYLLTEPPAPVHASGVRQAPAMLPRNGAIWLLGLMAMFSMIPEGAVLDWAALYMLDELGTPAERSGLAFAFFSGAMAVMRFAGDALRNRFGAVQTLRASGLTGAAGLLIAALAPSDTVALVGFFLSGLGVANMVPIMFSAAGNFPGMGAGAALSTVTMVGYAGILVAPSSIGFVAEAVGFRQTYGALALLLVGVTMMAGRTASADVMRPDQRVAAT